MRKERRSKGGSINLAILKTNLQDLVQQKTIELLLEPLLGVILGDLVGVSNTAAALLAASDTGALTVQMDEEIHTVNAGGGIVLDTKIDMLLDTETEAAGLGEVLVQELVLLDLKALLQDFLGLLTTDGDMAGDLLVTTNGERANGVLRAGEDGLLFRELFQHTGGTRQAIAGFTNANVQNELVDLNVAHRVFLLFRHLTEHFVGATTKAKDNEKYF